MNIFFLDLDPKLAAEYLDDVRVIKLIVEQAQMLSTAHRFLDGSLVKVDNKKHWLLPDSRENILYKVAHLNHPCTVWIRKNTSNYSWAYNYYAYLLEEYTNRYGKIHKSSELKSTLFEYPKNLPTGYLSPPPLAMPEKYHSDDVVSSYRNYFINEKSMAKNKPSSWKNQIPSWYNINN